VDTFLTWEEMAARAHPKHRKVNYLARMDRYRKSTDSAASRSASSSRIRTRKNPLPVRKDYRRKKKLSRNLTRYYDSCLSTAPRKYKGQRRKRYCAGVAWKRAKKSGRFRDYPGFSRSKSKENGMKSRKKSRIARGRPRDAKGHFVKEARARARGRTRARGRDSSSEARSRSARKGWSRRRRARAKDGAHDWKGQPRRHAKAARKGWKRRRYCGPRKRAGARAPSAQSGSRVRARARARARAREWPNDHEGHVRAGRKGWRRRRKCAPKSRARARARARARDWPGDHAGHVRAAKLGWRRKKARRSARKSKARRSHPRVRYVTKYRYVTKRRPSKKRRSSTYGLGPQRAERIGRRKVTIRRKHKKTHRHYPKSHMEGYTPPERQLAAEYTLSNPLTAGELVLVGITGLVGFGIADFVGRYLETTPVASGAQANSVPSGATVSNDVATLGWPSWQAMAGEFAVAAIPGIAAAFVDSPWARASLQGMMLGAGFSLVSGLWSNIMANLLGTTAIGQQLWLAEIEAQTATTSAASGTTTGISTLQGGTTTTPTAVPTVTPTVGTQGLPRGVGRRPMLPAGQRGFGQAASTISATVLPITAAPVATPANPPATAMVQPPMTPPATQVTTQAMPGGPSQPAPPLATLGGDCAGMPAVVTANDTDCPMPSPIPGIHTNTGDSIPTHPQRSAAAKRDERKAPDVTIGPQCAPAGAVASLLEGASEAPRNELPGHGVAGVGKAPPRLIRPAFHEIFPD
jgi:hypothetical protein